MYESKINPALAHMDLAQNEIATYALLVKRAQSSLTASMQAFERANETSITGNCQVRQELTNKLRQQSS
jgi:predicted DNA-binding transcriptional regulator